MKMLSNGFWLIVPILIWNALFYHRLPAKYQPELFDKEIHQVILCGENIIRVLIFGLPLLFSVGLTTKTQQIGLSLYLMGGLIYFLSWLPLIFAPDSAWGTKLIGFAAPAYTPILWICGIALLGDNFYIPSDYKPLYYLIPGIVFSVFHCTHAVTAYIRNF